MNFQRELLVRNCNGAFFINKLAGGECIFMLKVCSSENVNAAKNYLFYRKVFRSVALQKKAHEKHFATTVLGNWGAVRKFKGAAKFF
jgi:hypothetical protein